MTMTEKNYHCLGATCSKVRKERSNHYGKIYNIFCPVCASEGRSPLQSWECTDPKPEGAWVPEDWKPITVTIKEGE